MVVIRLLPIKKVLPFLIIIIFSMNLNSFEIYQNYVQVYGEGPIGQQLFGFDVKTYTKEDAVEFSRNEIMEFLSGMIYGYNFIYKVENKINNTKGYFEVENISKLRKDDKNISLTQLQESQSSIRIQGLYRLNEDQKTYMQGMHSGVSRTSQGDASGLITEGWDSRITVYKESLKNSILNFARKNYKSRPLYIKGKIFLEESPDILLISGEWRVLVKTHIFITTVNYLDSY
jgi:hypothetical protein